MGPNRRAQERERAAARAAEEAKRAEAERKAAAEAQKIVEIWNARQAGGRALWFYPTIGAAIAAGVPWLSFSCPGCGQFGSVDLRTLDRLPAARSRGLSRPYPAGGWRFPCGQSQRSAARLARKVSDTRRAAIARTRLPKAPEVKA